MLRVLVEFSTFLPYLGVLAVSLWIFHVPRGAIRNRNPNFRFQLADLFGLGILVQLALVGLIWDYRNHYFLFDFSMGNSLLSVGGTALAVVAGLWLMSVRHLEQLGVTGGWRRIGFLAVFMPAFFVFAVPTAVEGGNRLPRLIPRLFAELLPYEYQDRGVGHRPLSEQLPPFLIGVTAVIVAVFILRLWHVKLLQLDRPSLPDPAQKPSESPVNR